MMESKEQLVTTNDGLLVRAPAKINLSLLIAGKRPDGYHEIETIMAKVNWYDEILIEAGGEKGIELVCMGEFWAPQRGDNLIYKAARMLLDDAGRDENLKITLTKNIPAGSGLGSASSDAASTLIAINRFLDLGFDIGKLGSLAAKIGSDVNFFLNGPLAFCTGRGEKIEPIVNKFNFTAALILPGVSVATKRAYENYRHNENVYGQLRRKIKLYMEQNRLDMIAGLRANMLQKSCFELHPEIAELKNKIESAGIPPLCLSGSGSTLYSIFDCFSSKKEVEYKKVFDRCGCKSVIVSNSRW